MVPKYVAEAIFMLPNACIIWAYKQYIFGIFIAYFTVYLYFKIVLQHNAIQYNVVCLLAAQMMRKLNGSG